LILSIWFLDIFENDIILDCFAGSGNTGFAAKSLKRNAILIEINDKYVEYIQSKIVSVFELE
jgi:site-specific DNA-methyltransferase (adenine-specific)